MTMKMTAEWAFDSVPVRVDGPQFYHRWDPEIRKRIDNWFDGLAASIATEKDAEIARLQAELEKSVVDRDAEAARQAASLANMNGIIRHWTDIATSQTRARESAETAVAKLRAKVDELNAELDRMKPTTPKTRETAGEKLRELLAKAWGTYDFPYHAVATQAVAIELGLTDDPEPPSDGLLLRQACEKHRHPDDSCEASNWGLAAAEFLRRRTENHGGA